MKKKAAQRHVIHLFRWPDRMEAGKWIYREESRDVILMAVADGYAMVRRPRCVPYVALLREIEDGAMNPPPAPLEHTR